MMGVLPVSFWGYWAFGIIIIGLLFLVWLAVGIYRSDPKQVHPPDEVWDETLREGNTTPPKWWFMALFSVLIFSAVYIILYPGLGDNTGLLKWSQHTQLVSGTEYYLDKTHEIHKRWKNAPLAELSQHQSSMQSARRLFMSNCAACHGEDGRGQAGLFPSLVDDEWTWGNSEQQLTDSVSKGRVAIMPKWEGILTEYQIEAVAEYTLALSSPRISKQVTEGQQVYVKNCAVCHGAGGKGNLLLGSPALVNHNWLYIREGQSLREAVINSIRNGRQGIMPAQENRLHPEQIRVLVAWLKGGMKIAPLTQ